jgi:hypothetical protein
MYITCPDNSCLDLSAPTNSKIQLCKYVGIVERFALLTHTVGSLFSFCDLMSRKLRGGVEWQRHGGKEMRRELHVWVQMLMYVGEELG